MSGISVKILHGMDSDNVREFQALGPDFLQRFFLSTTSNLMNFELGVATISIAAMGGPILALPHNMEGLLTLLRPPALSRLDPSLPLYQVANQHSRLA